MLSILSFIASLILFVILIIGELSIQHDLEASLQLPVSVAMLSIITLSILLAFSGWYLDHKSRKLPLWDDMGPLLLWLLITFANLSQLSGWFHTACVSLEHNGLSNSDWTFTGQVIKQKNKLNELNYR